MASLWPSRAGCSRVRLLRLFVPHKLFTARVTERNDAEAAQRSVTAITVITAVVVPSDTLVLQMLLMLACMSGAGVLRKLKLTFTFLSVSGINRDRTAAVDNAIVAGPV